MGRNQRGAATIIVTVIMLITITLIVLFAANFTLFQEKSVSNLNHDEQAFEAAEAGLEFGIVYLQNNSAAILSNPSGGYIRNYTSTNTQNVSLADGATFSIVYTNPTQYNYSLIRVTSTGTSSDGKSSRVVTQEAYPSSLMSTPPTIPLGAQNTVTMDNNSTINNLLGLSTINSGSTVTLLSSAETLIFGFFPSSTAGHIGADITQSNAVLSALTNANFFAYYFGAAQGTVQTGITDTYTYTNSASTDYSTTLNGVNGTSILINQTGGTATISSGTVGSLLSPVLLLVNGNLSLTGTAQVHGLVYAVGGTSTTMSGSAYIDGGLYTTNPVSMTNSAYLLYDPFVVLILQAQLSGNYYGKVPGSWKDF